MLEILKNKKKEETEETEEKKINQKKDEDIDNKKNERKIQDKNNENCYIKKIDSYNYRPRTKIELFTKQNTLEFDSIPTENSTKMVTSGGIYTYIDTMIVVK